MAVYPLYVAPTPYNAVELIELDYSQAFDAIYLAHEFYAPGKFVRADHADWSYVTVAFGPAVAAPTGVSAVATTPNTDSANGGDEYFPQDYSYIIAAVDANGQESRGSAADVATNDTELPRNFTTISWSAVTGAEFYRVYKAHETGSHGFIGETESTSFVDDGFQPDYSRAPIEAFNPFGSAGNYPARTNFWEQRLWWARTTNAPNAFWASRSSEFENLDFARPQTESDSIAAAIATGETNSIEALIALDRLVVGTSDNIFTLQGPNDDILVPNPPPAARRQVGRGIIRPKPLPIGEVVFYQPRVETGVRTLGFAFEIDGYRSTDVTIFAPHLFEGKRIKQWAYQAEPHSIIWVVMDDGAMLSFTWEDEQQVWGWTEIDVGGRVLDVCQVLEGSEVRVYLQVERDLASGTRRFIERFGSWNWTDYRSAVYLDCARRFMFMEPQSEAGGLQHLEGETVTVLADGGAFSTTVTNGRVSLPVPAQRVIVGLPFDALVETMRLPEETKRKITGEIYVEMVDSFDVYGGRREDELELFRTRQQGEIAAPVMFTGQPEPVRPRQVVDRDAKIIIKSSSPYPMTLTAVHYGVEAK
jgi:hypothetical protein